MKVWQATCIVGALTFTGVILRVGGNTPEPTVPDTMKEAVVSAATPALAALSVVPKSSRGSAKAPGAQPDLVSETASRLSFVARFEGDASTVTASIDAGHHDAAQPSTTRDALVESSAEAPKAAAETTRDFRYLIYYIWSELPPVEKPAEVVLRSLKDIPVGTPVEEIKRASEAFGLDFNFMKAVAKIESGFDPKQRTGSYIGLFQLSKYEFNKFGSGDILDPRDNAVAAAYKVITEGVQFEWLTHRKPSLSDLYLIHQQGWEGAAEHIRRPDRIAWKSMCATSEGTEKGEKWCKRAIWRNTLPAVKQAWKSVDKLPSAAFVDMWRERVAEFRSKYMATASAEPANPH